MMPEQNVRAFPEEAYEPVGEAEEGTENKRPSFLRSQLMTVTQVSLCVLIIVFAVIVKSIGGSFYATAATWYFDCVNNSIFTGTAAPSQEVTDGTTITETSLTTADERRTSPEPVLPLQAGTITSPYGQREYNGQQQFHKGIDIAADKNTEIHALWSGTVITAEKDSSYGNYIVLRHDNNSETLYAHCERLMVRKGDKVSAGSVIGLVGETGDADGPHLHLEYRKDGKQADPGVLLGNAYS